MLWQSFTRLKCERWIILKIKRGKWQVISPFFKAGRQVLLTKSFAIITGINELTVYF